MATVRAAELKCFLLKCEWGGSLSRAAGFVHLQKTLHASVTLDNIRVISKEHTSIVFFFTRC